MVLPSSPQRLREPVAATLERTADDVRALYQQTAVTLAGTAVGLLLITVMFAGIAPPARLWSWFAAVALLIAVRVAMYLRFPQGEGVALPRLVAWRRRWNAVVLASAAGWGAAVWLFYGLGSNFHLQALILIVYSYTLAGVQLLAPQPRVYLAFMALGMLPTILRVALDTSDSYHLQLAGVMTLVCLLTIGLALVYRRAFESAIALRAEAEAARRAAEAANRARTQFFAAASHDLRQPLHALGLFAEALKSRVQGEPLAGLANDIGGSVEALEELFSELLDITRIEAGGVEPRPAHFRIGALFQRLELHFAPTAFEKGLALRFRGGAQHAYADPLLVERIVRNLLANAIRYTEDGGVLVGCRRRGERLLLQVWDTGVGIDAAEQERIYDEFYQVSGAAQRPAVGLGLGLAIVKRLAALMQAPLALRSVSGRGSVFTLELPLGRANAGPPAANETGLTLHGRRFVSVAGGAALELLLRSWGATLHAFEYAEDCEAWLRGAAGDAARPDLAIVDGVAGDALHALRERFGRALPAIVVADSAARVAEGEGLHVLVKPVAPNKLRALIGFKLGLR
jgi:signal transduction histidine kinase